MERSRAFALLLIALVLSAGAGPAAAQARWEPLPLWGGEVQIAAAPGDSPVLYVVSPTAGLFESRDRGATWRFVSRGPNRFRMKIFGVDPHDPRRLFVMTVESDLDQRGLFRSEDGGRRWSRSDAGLASTVSNLAFDPETPGTMWASTFEGIFRSVDGGRSWVLHAFDGRPVLHVAVSPSDPDVVFASVGDSPFSVQRSTDGGETFTEVLTGDLDRIVFDPSQPQRMYGVRQSMVFRSDDLGLTWTSQETTGQILDLAVTRSGVLIAGGFNPGIRRSLDGGATWEPVIGLPSPPYDGILSLAVLGDLTLAGGSRGVWRSQTEGRGWRPSSVGIRAQHAISLQVTGDDAAPTVWANTRGDFFKGSRGGAAFQSLFAPLSAPGGAYVWLFAVHPRQPDIAYAAGCCLENQFFSSLLKTEDGGESWQRLPFYSGPGSPTVLEVDPTNPDIVYVGGLSERTSPCFSVRSTDGGASWSCMVRFRERHLTEIAIDPRQPQNLFAIAGDELFRSTDRGASWPQVPTATKGIVRLEVDPFRSGRLYALAGNKLLRSDNGGRTWTRKLEVRQPSAMRDLLLDPERRDRIWATAALSEPGQPEKLTSKVFRSDDAGQSWHEVSSGLGARTVILDLAASPSSADVIFAGTAGQGLFRLETEESSN